MIERSLSFAIVCSNLNLRELESKNSSSVFLPSLDFNTNHGLRDSVPSVYSNAYGSDLNVVLSENLYDNGLSVTRYESAKIQKEISQLAFRNQRDQLILEFANEYMRYSLSVTLAAVQDEQFTIINKQYQSVSGQYEQGVKTRRDYLRFKTELRRSEIELQNSRTNIERSRIELMRLMGFELSDQIKPYDFIPIEIRLDTVAQVPTQAPELSQHYQYQIAKLQKKILENDVDVVRRAYWPELFLTAGATYHTGDYLGNNVGLYDNPTTSWNALLTLKFNLWDWGTRRRNVSIAEIRRSQQENGIASDLNNFSATNQKLMLDLKQSSKNFSLARELLDLETKSYSFTGTEYRNGKVTYLDIIVGLRDLLSAKVQMYTSYYDLRGQLLRYRYHEGTLYESVIEN